tara:strand:+ start:1265 stop:2185 length:921 start_codon:yes stop_codon:yes gene_type:complete
MDFIKKKIKDIKELKIQGAEDIAKTAVLVLRQCVHNSTALTKTRLLKELEKTKQELFKTRPTEPLMKNAVNYILSNLDGMDVEELKEIFYTNVKYTLAHFQSVEKRIACIGANKIRDGMIIFTHCHSSTVMGILRKAKQMGKRFEVHNTETRPLFQGRITAKELSKLKIPVTHYVDSAMRLAIKDADLVLLGADAITSEKAINKIGSEIVAELAKKYDIPVYVCCNSWKFDYKTIFGFGEELEVREAKEIWKSSPKSVKIVDYAFEKIDLGLITAIISETGVHRPSVFIEEIGRNCAWMCNDPKLI